MSLANQTFNLFSQAAGNAGGMYGQGLGMLGSGLGQMDQASAGYGMMAGGMPGAMRGYGQAQRGLRQGMGLFGQMGQQLGGATGAYNRMAGMSPSQIQEQSLAGTDLGGYMNPFQRQVTDATMGELGRQEKLQDLAIQDQAQRAGAFGGDRMAIQQAENNRNFDQTRAQTLANLNFQNFGNAQSMATNDINRNFQAQQANQGMNAGMMQAGAAGLANMAGQGASGLSSLGQFGVSGLGGLGQSGLSGLGGLGQSMASMGQNQQQFGQQQLGGLAQQGFGMGQNLEQRTMAAGNQQQQQMQSILDAIKAQTLGWQNYGDVGLARYFGATQSPNGYGTSNTKGTVTTSSSPGIGGILGSIAQIGGMFL
jgi:hypothetical protein